MSFCKVILPRSVAQGGNLRAKVSLIASKAIDDDSDSPDNGHDDADDNSHDTDDDSPDEDKDSHDTDDNSPDEDEDIHDTDDDSADEYRFYRLAARADLRLSQARTTLHDNDHHHVVEPNVSIIMIAIWLLLL